MFELFKSITTKINYNYKIGKKTTNTLRQTSITIIYINQF